MRTKALIGRLAAALVTLSQPTWAAADTVSFEVRHHAHQTYRPAPLARSAVSGLIPRAVRGGNPLQMLNPFAPAKYGTAEENVVFDPDVPGKAEGINFLKITF